MSVNTMLLECNRQQSEEYLSGNTGNNSMWTNNVSEGLQLNPGDRVSVSSAFINEVGSGSQTIEFNDDFVETGVHENSMSITFEYYKSADAECCLMMPRNYIPSTKAQEVAGSALPTAYATPNDTADAYKGLYRREYDGARYTVYEAIDKTVNLQAAWMRAYQRVEKVLLLTVDTGYNTPSNICSQLTEQLHASDDPVVLKKPDDTPYSTTISSPTFQPFQCAYEGSFNAAAFTDRETSVADGQTYMTSTNTICVYDPELFEAGIAVNSLSFSAGEGSFGWRVEELSGTTLEISAEYTPAILLAFKKLFAAQSSRSDLIFGTLNGFDASTANTRFIHINKEDQSGTTWNSLGSGDDSNMTYRSTRQFIVFNEADAEDASKGYGFATASPGLDPFIIFHLRGEQSNGSRRPARDARSVNHRRQP